MKIITVAIAGLGPRGFHMYGKYQLLHPERMKVTALADPDEEKLKEARRVLGVPEENCYRSAEEMFSLPRLADVAFIATQDAQHLAHATAALEKGYDLLLEKPIATTLKDCFGIMNKSLECNKRVIVCHVLRYTTFYRTIKELIEGGRVGDIVNVDAVENVGYWHQAHSFVRGNWRNSDQSSPMILAKCCHDLDILNFLTGKRCVSLNSYGSTKFFVRKNMPPDAAERCLDCKYRDEGVYSAKRIYLSGDSLERYEWLCYVVAQPPTFDNLEDALKLGPYGRCVFCCDNNVVDHQTVNIRYEDDVTATLTMSAFSQNSYRTIRIMGTAGEIEGNQDTNIIRYTRFGEAPVYYDIKKIATDLSGHGGGDNAMLADFFRTLDEGGDMSSSIIRSMQSHIMAFAAEDSRVEGGKNIDLEEFEKINNCGVKR